eukprot:gnl/TRDRNA2_/TRDRNA2_170038_c0_seq6.p1 gnl/TRDRNA2_/TRDRNA2_170038_c0~~gnl/TRDRNA2_/TRDRNA2_170038_c0_seq6.p1  ORF type:complete len:466 (+),score=113.85 gnl/TRDRNA2_/TRDRNA2_170038_c0_seq6:69-1400(+)
MSDVPPRPEWLPSEGPGNLNVPPEKWGMTLRQWCAFILACKLADIDLWKMLEASTERKEAGYVNLYQICDTYVKPWTRNMGSSVALLLNAEDPKQAEVMISHAWGECIMESVTAVVGAANKWGMTLDTVIWFCTFAQYQPGDMEGDCGPGVAAQLALDPFKCVIASQPTFGMFVIHTSKVNLYGRLWCVFEVSESKKSTDENGAAPARAAMSMAYSAQLVQKAMEAGVEITCEEHIKEDTSQADCFSEEDKAMITAKIEESDGGFEALDNMILDFRKASLESTEKITKSIASWMISSGIVTEDQMETKEQLLQLIALTIQGFGEHARLSGFLVLCTCLLQCADGKIDDAQKEKIMIEARSRISKILPESLLDSAGFDFPEDASKFPPTFDSAKQPTDELIEGLMNDDDVLMNALTDLHNFPLPVGWLEVAFPPEDGVTPHLLD